MRIGNFGIGSSVVSIVKLRKRLLAFALAIATAAICGQRSRAFAAEDLKLAPALSFTDDSSSNFPIVADHGADGALRSDQATILFFGTAHCWNTNREAERLVSLYPKYRGRIHFIIVDLNSVSASQRPLVAKYYRGAIPTIAVLDSRGQVIYDRAGETATERGNASNLESLLNSVH